MMSTLRNRAAQVLYVAVVCGAVGLGSPSEASNPGPRILLLPDRTVPMVSCTVLVPAGSVYETASTNGAAHYLEHLLFNGTKTRTREDIYARTDFLGAYNNASTQRERTVFQLLLPSENWREGIELQADMLLHSTLPEDMFTKERGIILEELAKDRSQASYNGDVAEVIALWGTDPRALPVLGTETSIQGLRLEDVREYYASTYRPEAMTIVLMGDFDQDEARRELDRLYGAQSLPKEEGSPKQMPPRPPFPAKRQLLSRPIPELDAIRVRILAPLPEIASPKSAAAILLAETLTDGVQAAISRAITEKFGTPLAAWASFEGGEPWSLLTLGVDLPASGLSDPAATSAISKGGVVEAILAHLEELVSSTAWSDDVDRARMSRFVAETQLREKMHYFGLERADLLGSNNVHLALEMPARIAAVEASEVAALLSEVTRGPLLATVFGPEVPVETKELPPPATSARPALQSGGGQKQMAIPANPRTETSQIRTITRKDGLTLVVHSTPDPPTLALHALLRDRDGVERRSGVPLGTADVAHRMMELGTAKKTKDELRGALAAIGASLKVTDVDGIPYDDYYYSSEYSYVRLETLSGFAEDALSLLGEILWAPRLDEDTFSAALAAAKVRAERDAGAPSENARRRFFAALGGEAQPLARSVCGTPESHSHIDLDAVRRLHPVLAAPQNLILAVSSNLPPERIESWVNAAFPMGAAPAIPEAAKSASGGGSTGTEWVNPELAGRHEFLIETGREQSTILLGAPLRVRPEDESALRVACSLLSERLADRLREREGLAYTIGASLRLQHVESTEGGQYVMMSAGTRPENLEKMESGMRTVARELASTPTTAEAIVGALNRGEGQLRMRRLTRMGQAYAFSMAAFQGRDPAALDADIPKLRAVTPADVARVAREYLSFNDSIVAIAK